MKKKKQNKKNFTCSACNERFEESFIAWQGLTYDTDENGFDDEEITFTQLCGNCHGPTVCKGMVLPEGVKEVSDELPF